MPVDLLDQISEEGKLSLPFNPRDDVSADARYLWKKIFVWFWLVPSIAGLIWFVATH